jgi:hypothetical protein
MESKHEWQTLLSNRKPGHIDKISTATFNIEQKKCINCSLQKRNIKKIKNQRHSFLGLDLSININKCHTNLVTQSL